MRPAIAALCLAGAVAAGVALAGSPLGDDGGPTATPVDSGTGARQLADLGLTRLVPPDFESACGRLVAYAPRNVARCPPVVPAGDLEVELAAPLSRQERYRGGYTMSLASCSLNSYRGRAIDTNGCHWAYEVAWTRRTRRLVVGRVVHGSGNPADPRSACRWEELAGARARSCRVPAFERGGGFHGGHVAYVWERRPAALVLFAHGYADEVRVRAMMTALIRAAADP